MNIFGIKRHDAEPGIWSKDRSRSPSDDSKGHAHHSKIGNAIINLHQNLSHHALATQQCRASPSHRRPHYPKKTLKEAHSRITQHSLQQTRILSLHCHRRYSETGGHPQTRPHPPPYLQYRRTRDLNPRWMMHHCLSPPHGLSLSCPPAHCMCVLVCLCIRICVCMSEMHPELSLSCLPGHFMHLCMCMCMCICFLYVFFSVRVRVHIQRTKHTYIVNLHTIPRG